MANGVSWTSPSLDMHFVQLLLLSSAVILVSPSPVTNRAAEATTVTAMTSPAVTPGHFIHAWPLLTMVLHNRNYLTQSQPSLPR
jgi:hypothetical protein